MKQADSTSDLERHNYSNSKRRVVTTNTLPFAELKSQDPSVFAHLLADHFVAREASNATATAASTFALKRQQLARPVAGSVTLGSFRSWQFGERCLATYRVLFGRPLWAASTPTSVTSPRPRKRKHLTPPTSSSSEASDGGNVDQLNTLEMETNEGLLALPTVEELLELPTDDSFGLKDKEEGVDDVLASLVIGLDEGAGNDAIDFLWDLDASEGVMLTEGEEEKLRFLDTSPNSFVEMDDI